MDSINFKARYVTNKYSVKAWSNAKNKYMDKPVRLVKVDYDSEMDYEALKTLSKLWSQEDNFIDTILAKLLYSRRNKKAPRSEVYLLTLQKKVFKKLDPKKILGIAETTTIDKTSSLDYIQSRPDSMYGKPDRKFSKIGDVLTEYIIKKFGRNNLYGHSKRDKIPFYKRHGFVVAQPELIEPLIKYMPDNIKK